MNIDILLLHLDFSTIHCLYAPRHLSWDTSENTRKLKMAGLAWIIILLTHTLHLKGFSQ